MILPLSVEVTLRLSLEGYYCLSPESEHKPGVCGNQKRLIILKPDKQSANGAHALEADHINMLLSDTATNYCIMVKWAKL